eukprot:1160781-Pelagomonas_calceolata.AAC.17
MDVSSIVLLPAAKGVSSHRICSGTTPATASQGPLTLQGCLNFLFGRASRFPGWGLPQLFVWEGSQNSRVGEAINLGAPPHEWSFAKKTGQHGHRARMSTPVCMASRTGEVCSLNASAAHIKPKLEEKGSSDTVCNGAGFATCDAHPRACCPIDALLGSIKA